VTPVISKDLSKVYVNFRVGMTLGAFNIFTGDLLWSNTELGSQSEVGGMVVYGESIIAGRV
jgi:outer membrane protein assembly factor BamB